MDYDALVRVLGPGSYTRIAEKVGVSRQHIGRVLRGDSRGSDALLSKISKATGVTVEDIRGYIDSGGSPTISLPALRLHHGVDLRLVPCPEHNGSKWDGLRELVRSLKVSEMGPTKQSALRVVLPSNAEAKRAAQCLHSGKRSEANILRRVDFTTSVEGNVLAVWRRG